MKRAKQFDRAMDKIQEAADILEKLSLRYDTEDPAYAAMTDVIATRLRKMLIEMEEEVEL